MNKVVLCADIGTSSLKAALIDSAGDVLSISRIPFKNDCAQKTALQWLPSLLKAVEEMSETTKGLSSISLDALAVSGNGPTFVSEDGSTVMWNTPDRIVKPVKGCSLFIPKLITFKNTYTKEYLASSYIISGPEYLIYLLTDTLITILPEDRYVSAYWDNCILQQNGFSVEEIKKLPPFVKPGFNAGKLKNSLLLKIKEYFPKTKDVSVYCGAPDFVAALAGSGTLSHAKICDRAGSSEGINFCTREKLCGDDIRTLPSIISDLWNASVLIPQSGKNFDIYKTELESIKNTKYSYDSLTRELLSPTVKDGDLLKGQKLLTQTALQVKKGLDILKEAYKGTGEDFPDIMTITGGQSKNDLWLQYKADITQIKIAVPKCNDAELIGDAIFAFTGMGLYHSYEDAARVLCKPGKIFTPHNNKGLS